MSCPIDTSALPTLTLSFRSMINNYAGGYNCSVKSRSSEADPWADVSPWVNPISASIPAAQYTIDITGDISTTTQVMFEFSGYYFNLNYWYVDDFVCGTYSTDYSGNFPPVQISTISEYDQTTTVEIAAGTTMNVSLPEWTPTDLPFATTIDYLINASVSMNVSDENPANNQLIKIITLNYEHDVGVIEIITEPEIPWKNPGSITVSDYVLNISGIIQNFGVTYTEVDIPVNAQITKDLIVIYDETVIIPGLLAPGATATVTFPPASIPYEEGDFKLSMQTQLVGDDHPNNNKKIKTWGFVPPDQTPPVTTANITGTMGQNGWYISKPIVTLTAVDPDGKRPSGVNATYIKIDNGAWEVYTVPVTIQGDGTHTVQYYSDDKAGNVEDIHTAPTFKVDTTAPTWNTYTFTAQNAMKNKWLCEADVTDATSGVVLVEFYVDDAFVGNATTAPYTFLFEGKPTNNSQALAYDAAGNSAFSPIAQYYEMNYQTQQFFQQKDL
jgi:hypothetical protein